MYGIEDRCIPTGALVSNGKLVCTPRVTGIENDGYMDLWYLLLESENKSVGIGNPIEKKEF